MLVLTAKRHPVAEAARAPLVGWQVQGTGAEPGVVVRPAGVGDPERERRAGTFGERSLGLIGAQRDELVEFEELVQSIQFRLHEVEEALD